VAYLTKGRTAILAMNALVFALGNRGERSNPAELEVLDPAPSLADRGHPLTDGSVTEQQTIINSPSRD